MKEPQRDMDRRKGFHVEQQIMNKSVNGRTCSRESKTRTRESLRVSNIKAQKPSCKYQNKQILTGEELRRVKGKTRHQQARGKKPEHARVMECRLEKRIRRGRGSKEHLQVDSQVYGGGGSRNDWSPVATSSSFLYTEMRERKRRESV